MLHSIAKLLKKSTLFLKTPRITLFCIKSHAPFGRPYFKFFKIVLEYLMVFSSIMDATTKEQDFIQKKCD